MNILMRTHALTHISRYIRICRLIYGIKGRQYTDLFLVTSVDKMIIYLHQVFNQNHNCIYYV